LLAGHPEDILPCIGCIECREEVLAEHKIICAVNPSVGKEKEFALVPASQQKRVMIVGGGPAGMTAARVAALRGHQVTLYEKALRLGGQLLVAEKPPCKGAISSLTEFLIDQLEKVGVSVKTGERVTPAMVRETNPDVIILATGLNSAIPVIPGIEKAAPVQATEVLAGVEVGKRVVVIGGESVGCETSDLLAEKGCQVTVTRRGREMATKMLPSSRKVLLNRLKEKGVRLIVGVSYEGVEKGGLMIAHPDGRREILPADTIVLAVGARPNVDLARELDKDFPIYVIGDAKEPRRIKNAIEEGFATTLSI
jgi:pyruvate/2-oxoglutarate dehydrogenase complex dihydrolipoamide dehydrogenase (E3) component